jgi:hypothetical protein
MVAVLSYDKYVGTCLSSRNCNSLSVAVSCCKLSVYVSGVNTIVIYMISGIKAILQDSSVKIASVITRVSSNML